MTKYYSVLVVALLLAGVGTLPGTTHAFGLNASTSADVRMEHKKGDGSEHPEDRRAGLNARMEARMHGEGEGHGMELRAKLKDDLKARVGTFTTRIFTSFTEGLDRLETFSAKVDTRLDELSAKVDVSKSREALTNANEVRVATEANILDLKVQLNTKLSAETSRTEIMALIKEAREQLREARKAYMDVLLQIRADVKASS